jgi:hypothetical protein
MADACVLGSGHRLILDSDRCEAVLGDAKRHRSAVVVASPDRERPTGTDLRQQAGADQLIDALPLLRNSRRLGEKPPPARATPPPRAIFEKL